MLIMEKTTDFRLIALDETSYWNLPEYAGKIRGIERVYLYDRKRAVHLCEIMPSYELIPIETRAVFEDDVSEEDRERIQDKLQSNEDWDTAYMLCHTVDAIYNQLSRERFRTATVRFEVDPEDNYQEQLEAVMDHCRGNSLL